MIVSTVLATIKAQITPFINLFCLKTSSYCPPAQNLQSKGPWVGLKSNVIRIPPTCNYLCTSLPLWRDYANHYE